MMYQNNFSIVEYSSQPVKLPLCTGFLPLIHTAGPIRSGTALRGKALYLDGSHRTDHLQGSAPGERAAGFGRSLAAIYPYTRGFTDSQGCFIFAMKMRSILIF